MAWLGDLHRFHPEILFSDPHSDRIIVIYAKGYEGWVRMIDRCNIGTYVSTTLRLATCIPPMIHSAVSATFFEE